MSKPTETFFMQFRTDNAAFGDDKPAEVARILRDVADRIERGEATGLHQNAKDINGNTVGTFFLT